MNWGKMNILITFLVGWAQVICNVIIALKENNLPFNHAIPLSGIVAKNHQVSSSRSFSLLLVGGKKTALTAQKRQLIL